MSGNPQDQDQPLEVSFRGNMKQVKKESKKGKENRAATWTDITSLLSSQTARQALGELYSATPATLVLFYWLGFLTLRDDVLLLSLAYQYRLLDGKVIAKMLAQLVSMLASQRRPINLQCLWSLQEQMRGETVVGWSTLLECSTALQHATISGSPEVIQFFKEQYDKLKAEMSVKWDKAVKSEQDYHQSNASTSMLTVFTSPGSRAAIGFPTAPPSTAVEPNATCPTYDSIQ